MSPLSCQCDSVPNLPGVPSAHSEIPVDHLVMSFVWFASSVIFFPCSAMCADGTETLRLQFG